VHVVRYFHGLFAVSEHGPSLPLRPLPKKKKKKETSTQNPQYKQREAKPQTSLVRVGLFFFFPYADVVADF